MREIDRSVVLKQIQDRLKKRFPINCRVQLTPSAAKLWPRYAGVAGTIVRHTHSGTSPCVLWDGRKTPKGYHEGYLKRV